MCIKRWVKLRRKKEGGFRVIFGLQMHEDKSVADRIKNYHISEITNCTINILKDIDEYINKNEK